MKLAAVAFISFFENSIEQKIVEVEDGATWKDAYSKAAEEGLHGSESAVDTYHKEWIESLPDSLDDARVEIVNGEIDISVVFYDLDSKQ